MGAIRTVDSDSETRLRRGATSMLTELDQRGSSVGKVAARCVVVDRDEGRHPLKPTRVSSPVVSNCNDVAASILPLCHFIQIRPYLVCHTLGLKVEKPHPIHLLNGPDKGLHFYQPP
jgi:hypothetical protein